MVPASLTVRNCSMQKNGCCESWIQVLANIGMNHEALQYIMQYSDIAMTLNCYARETLVFMN